MGSGNTFAPAQLPAGHDRMWPAGSVRFVALFLALVALSYLLVATLGLVDPYLGWASRSAGFALSVLGEEIVVTGNSVASPRFTYVVMIGCGGLEPLQFLLAGILAFPAPWKRRLAGLLLSLIALQFINLVRLVSLYYVGVHQPGSFELVHLDIWQPLFLVLAALLWFQWARWAMRSTEQR